jgi:hypothetical protein
MLANDNEPTKLDVSSLDKDKAVQAVEQRLYQLLAPRSEATSLEVTVAKGVKGRPNKAAILKAMKEWVFTCLL